MPLTPWSMYSPVMVHPSRAQYSRICSNWRVAFCSSVLTLAYRATRICHLSKTFKRCLNCAGVWGVMGWGGGVILSLSSRAAFRDCFLSKYLL